MKEIVTLKAPGLKDKTFKPTRGAEAVTCDILQSKYIDIFKKYIKYDDLNPNDTDYPRLFSSFSGSNDMSVHDTNPPYESITEKKGAKLYFPECKKCKIEDCADACPNPKYYLIPSAFRELEQFILSKRWVPTK